MTLLILCVNFFFSQFSKALNRFQREDPTFRVGLDPESGQVCFLKFVSYISLLECFFTCNYALV